VVQVEDVAERAAYAVFVALSEVTRVRRGFVFVGLGLVARSEYHRGRKDLNDIVRLVNAFRCFSSQTGAMFFPDLRREERKTNERRSILFERPVKLTSLSRDIYRST
jgi:hypothetical protein